MPVTGRHGSPQLSGAPLRRQLTSIMKDMAPVNLLIEVVTVKLKLLRDFPRLSSWRLLQKIKRHHSEQGEQSDLPHCPDPVLFQEFTAGVEKSIQSRVSERRQSSLEELDTEWKPFAATLAIKAPKAAALNTTTTTAAEGDNDNAAVAYAAYALALKEPLKLITKGRRLGEQRAACSSASAQRRRRVAAATGYGPCRKRADTRRGQTETQRSSPVSV